MASDASRDLDRVVEHYVSRLRQGEHPNVEDYAKRHPELAAEIREVFPLLSLMEGVKGAEGARAGGANPTAEQPLPRRIASYQIVRPIGRGGMGVVHEGRAEDGSRVAVKVIHPHLLGETRYVARFLREAEIGSHIRHENVVRTLESGVLQTGSQGLPYLVLEFVEGQSLRALLDEVGRVPERLCRHIGLCVARALEVFEAAGVVHRDLKPANVVITPDETVKVMDLGVASLQEAEEQLTKTGQFVGSFRYAAPEQLAGKRVDGRADLYSLGLLLYELSTGVHPASAREDQTVLVAPPPSTLGAGLSAFFDAVVEKLLRPAPADRFTSAAELREALEAGEASRWWRRGAAQRVAAPRLPAITPFHGRDAELAALGRAAARLQENGGAVVLLEGEAGIGKSRLVQEWLNDLAGSMPRARVLLARHDPGEGGSALFPLGNAVVDHLGSEELEAALDRHLGSDTRLAVPLAAYLRGEGADVEGAGRLPGALSVGLLQLFRALAAEAPLVVAIEDLHFAGQATRSLVPYLARGLAGHPALLLCSTRPLEEEDPVLEVLVLAHAERLGLSGLDTEDRMALIDDVLGTGDLHPRDVAELARKSDGNPYFLLELVGNRGGQAVDRASNDTDSTVPTTLQALLQRRLGALSNTDRELLEAAACCGYVFDPQLLAEASGRGLIGTLKSLGRLERRGGLVAGRGSVYRFHHHLLQEVLYGEQHPRLREAHHAALGTVLLGRIDDPEDVDPGTAVELCTHLFRGRMPLEAAPYVFLATQHCRIRGEYDRSRELLEEALAVDGVLQGEARARALYLAGAGAHVGSDFPRAERWLREACELAQEVGAEALSADALRSYANLKYALREYPECDRLAQESVEAARRVGDGAREGWGHLTLADSLLTQGRLAEAAAAGDAAAELSRLASDPDLEASVGLSEARCAQALGDLGAARRHAEASATLMREHGNRGREFQAVEVLGGVAFREGRFADALAVTERLVHLGTELGFLRFHAGLIANGSACLHQLGRFPEALARADEAALVARRLGQVAELPRVVSRRAAALTALGRLEEARALFDADGLPAAGRMRQSEEVIRRTALAELLGTLGRFEEGHEVLDQCSVRRGRSERGHQVRKVEFAEAMLLERAGRDEAARAVCERLLEERDEVSGAHGQIPLLAGRTALRIGDLDRARLLFEAALTWGRRSGCVPVEIPARVYLARLPGGDLLAARVELEQHEARLPRYDALDAHAALWEHTGDDAHLDRAREILEVLRAGAAPADRDRMLERVALYRRVVEA